MKGLRFNILFVTCASLLYFKHNYTMSLRRCSCYDNILSLSTYTMEYVVFVLLFCLISKFEKWSSRARTPQTPQPFRTAAGFLVYFEFICYKDFFIFHIWGNDSIPSKNKTLSEILAVRNNIGRFGLKSVLLSFIYESTFCMKCVLYCTFYIHKIICDLNAVHQANLETRPHFNTWKTICFYLIWGFRSQTQ